MERSLWALISVALASAPALGAQQDPVAMIVDVRGDVRVEAAGSAPLGAALGQRVYGGDRVLPGSGGRAVLILRSGAQQIVTAPTTVAAPSGQAASDLFTRAMSALAYAASDDARQRGGRMAAIRPTPGATGLLSPDTAGFAGARPRFSWTATEGARRYTVQIERVGSGMRRAFETTDTTLVLPDSVPELVRGAEYAWSVSAHPSGRSSSAVFRVIPVVPEVELRARLDQLAAAGLASTTGGALLNATLYRDAGLLYDALHALLELGRSDAPLGSDYYNLLGDVLNRVGRFDDADAAFARARD